MRLHANALLGPKGREVMVLRVLEQGWSVTEAAQAAGVSGRTCSKWLGRYRAEGSLGLVDRPSTPKHSPTRTPEDRVQLIATLRRLRMTAAEIAFCLGMALSTVSAVLRRINLGECPMFCVGMSDLERHVQAGDRDGAAVGGGSRRC